MSKPQVGEWYWTLEWIESSGGYKPRSPTAHDADWVYRWGEVVFVGETITVFRNVVDGHVNEWSQHYGVRFKTTAEMRAFFEKVQGHTWPNDSWEKWLDENKLCWPSYVACHKHGNYDVDELCWKCEKELRNVKDQG